MSSGVNGTFIPPWVAMGYDLPPVGATMAGPIVCAIVYFLVAIANFVFMRRSTYRPAMGMAVACVCE